MYQALYRKYRPKLFEDVVGQKVIKQTLTNSIVNDKISHAYLFTGPRGTGKTSIAKILAKIVNCESLEKTTPCNICKRIIASIGEMSIMPIGGIIPLNIFKKGSTTEQTHFIGCCCQSIFGNQLRKILTIINKKYKLNRELTALETI